MFSLKEWESLSKRSGLIKVPQFFTLNSNFIEVDECAHVLWKADDDIKQGLKFFKQREAILLDTKLRYLRENRYLRETKKTR